MPRKVVAGLVVALAIVSLPMFGDYYTNNMLSNSPRTTMIGNIIQEKFLQELNYPEAAALSVMLMLVMLVLATVYAKALGTEDSALAAGATGG